MVSKDCTLCFPESQRSETRFTRRREALSPDEPRPAIANRGYLTAGARLSSRAIPVARFSGRACR